MSTDRSSRPGLVPALLSVLLGCAGPSTSVLEAAQARIEALERENAVLKERVQELEKRLVTFPLGGPIDCSTYKGQVRIQDVQEAASTGRILGEKSPIEVGDSATTGL